MSTTTKSPRELILPVAEHLLDVLGQFCTRIELAGSLRRRAPLVGDIEIVAIPVPRLDLFGHPIAASTALDVFLSDRVALVKDGPRYKQFVYRGHAADLFLATNETWGSIFTLRTGSADFSHWLVTRRPHGACPPSVAFIEGRLHAHGRLLHTPEEIDVFHALGLVYIEPDQRTGPLPHAARLDPVWNYEQ